VGESDVWFFDDTRDHTDLIAKIKDHYIETKKYEVKLPNPKIAEFLITSFPKDVFNPGTAIGKVFLKAYSDMESYFIVTPPGELYLTKANPRLNPKGPEDQKKLLEMLVASLREISPLASGRVKGNWSAADTAADISKLMKALEPAFLERTYKVPEKSLNLATATAYSETIGGSGGHFRRRSKTRKSKKHHYTRSR
jgi:hypothetical protein